MPGCGATSRAAQPLPLRRGRLALLTLTALLLVCAGGTLCCGAAPKVARSSVGMPQMLLPNIEFTTEAYTPFSCLLYLDRDVVPSDTFLDYIRRYSPDRNRALGNVLPTASTPFSPNIIGSCTMELIPGLGENTYVPLPAGQIPCPYEDDAGMYSMCQGARYVHFVALRTHGPDINGSDSDTWANHPPPPLPPKVGQEGGCENTGEGGGIHQTDEDDEAIHNESTLNPVFRTVLVADNSKPPMEVLPPVHILPAGEVLQSDVSKMYVFFVGVHPGFLVSMSNILGLTDPEALNNTRFIYNALIVRSRDALEEHLAGTEQKPPWSNMIENSQGRERQPLAVTLPMHYSKDQWCRAAYRFGPSVSQWLMKVVLRFPHMANNTLQEFNQICIDSTPQVPFPKYQDDSEEAQSRVPDLLFIDPDASDLGFLQGTTLWGIAAGSHAMVVVEWLDDDYTRTTVQGASFAVRRLCPSCNVLTLSLSRMRDWQSGPGVHSVDDASSRLPTMRSVRDVLEEVKALVTPGVYSIAVPSLSYKHLSNRTDVMNAVRAVEADGTFSIETVILYSLVVKRLSATEQQNNGKGTAEEGVNDGDGEDTIPVDTPMVGNVPRGQNGPAIVTRSTDAGFDDRDDAVGGGLPYDPERETDAPTTSPNDAEGNGTSNQGGRDDEDENVLAGPDMYLYMPFVDVLQPFSRPDIDRGAAEQDEWMSYSVTPHVHSIRHLFNEPARVAAVKSNVADLVTGDMMFPFDWRSGYILMGEKYLSVVKGPPGGLAWKVAQGWTISVSPVATLLIAYDFLSIALYSPFRHAVTEQRSTTVDYAGRALAGPAATSQLGLTFFSAAYDRNETVVYMSGGKYMMNDMSGFPPIVPQPLLRTSGIQAATPLSELNTSLGIPRPGDYSDDILALHLPIGVTRQRETGGPQRSFDMDCRPGVDPCLPDWKPCGKLPAAMSGHWTGLGDDGFMYLFGGLSDSVASNRLYRAVPGEWEWESLDSSPYGSRTSPAGVYYRNTTGHGWLFFFGTESSGKTDSSLTAYSIEDREWHRYTDFDMIPAVPHCVMVTGTSIVAMIGSTMHRFEPETMRMYKMNIAGWPTKEVVMCSSSAMPSSWLIEKSTAYWRASSRLQTLIPDPGAQQQSSSSSSDSGGRRDQNPAPANSAKSDSKSTVEEDTELEKRDPGRRKNDDTDDDREGIVPLMLEELAPPIVLNQIVGTPNVTLMSGFMVYMLQAGYTVLPIGLVCHREDNVIIDAIGSRCIPCAHQYISDGYVCVPCHVATDEVNPSYVSICNVTDTGRASSTTIIVVTTVAGSAVVVGVALLVLFLLRRRRALRHQPGYQLTANAPKSGPAFVAYVWINNAPQLWREQPNGMAVVSSQLVVLLRGILASHGCYEILNCGDSGLFTAPTQERLACAASELWLQVAQRRWPIGRLTMNALLHRDTFECVEAAANAGRKAMVEVYSLTHSHPSMFLVGGDIYSMYRCAMYVHGLVVTHDFLRESDPVVADPADSDDTHSKSVSNPLVSSSASASGGAKAVGGEVVSSDTLSNSAQSTSHTLSSTSSHGDAKGARRGSCGALGSRQKVVDGVEVQDHSNDASDDTHSRLSANSLSGSSAQHNASSAGGHRLRQQWGDTYTIAPVVLEADSRPTSHAALRENLERETCMARLLRRFWYRRPASVHTIAGQLHRADVAGEAVADCVDEEDDGPAPAPELIAMSAGDTVSVAFAVQNDFEVAPPHVSLPLPCVALRAVMEIAPPVCVGGGVQGVLSRALRYPRWLPLRGRSAECSHRTPAAPEPPASATGPHHRHHSSVMARTCVNCGRQPPIATRHCRLKLRRIAADTPQSPQPRVCPMYVLAIDTNAVIKSVAAEDQQHSEAASRLRNRTPLFDARPVHVTVSPEDLLCEEQSPLSLPLVGVTAPGGASHSSSGFGQTGRIAGWRMAVEAAAPLQGGGDEFLGGGGGGGSFGASDSSPQTEPDVLLHPIVTSGLLTPQELGHLVRIAEKLYLALMVPLRPEEQLQVAEMLRQRLRIFTETFPLSRQRAREVGLRVLQLTDMLHVRELVENLAELSHT